MRLRLSLLVLALAGLAAAVPTDPAPRAAAVGGGAFVPPPRLPDPFPLRRVFLPGDDDPRLAAEPGGFRRLGRDEFEARVQAAAAAAAARADPPRVQQALYRATYSAGQLAGSATWRVGAPAGRPGFVSLDPLGLAVGAAAWGDGRPATLTRDADRVAGGTAVWVDDPAGGAVTAPWSLRGTESADEDRFEIAAPPAPVSVWEFRLPADRTAVAASAGVLLSGPFEGGTAGDRTWRVAAGNAARWELRVRRPPPPGDAVPRHAARAARHVLAPGSATAVVDFALESPRRPVRDWTFQVDPPLAVTDVTGDDVDGWAADGGTLTVRLREASAGTRLRIGAGAPLPGGATAWPCPTVKPTDGTVGADTVEVAVHPDFKLDGWAAGDYRVAGAGVPPDRGYRLAFVGGPAAADGDRRPPTVRVRPAEVELATDESLEWLLAPGRNRLTAVVKARVVRGPAPAVAVQLAAGYAVEAVTAVPDDPGMTWAAGPANTWAVEPSRPLGTGQSAELRFEVRGPPAPFAGDPVMAEPLATAVAWPKFTVLSAADRQGTVRVTAGGGLKATAVSPADDGAVAYRGREPDGTLALTAARPAVAVTAAEFGPPAAAAVRLTCRADGPVHSVTVFAPGEATVRADADAAVVRRLPVVGTLGLTPLFTAASGWAAVAAAGLPDAVSGSLWRVTFPAAERGEFAFRVDGLPTRPVARGVRVELPVVCGADAAAVAVADARPRVTADDLRRALKTFPPSVTLHDAPAAPPAPPDLRFADLRLLTAADTDGRLTAVLSGVATGGGRRLSVGLPAGATAESAAVAGKRLAAVPTANGAVVLPLPATADPVPFELRYRLPGNGGTLLRRLESPPPALPGDPPLQREWAFPDGCRAWPGLAAQADPDPRADEVVWAIPARVAAGASYALAAVLLGVAAGLVRAGGRGLWPFAALGLLLGAAVWAAPGGWPALLRPAFVAVAGGVAVLVLVRPARPTAAPPSAASAPVLALLLAAVGVAQAPAPAVVYVVPDPADAGRFRVYAPPAVLDRLDRLAATALPPAVLLSASYDAVAGEDAATVDAAFVVLGTRDGPHPLTVPLAGVRLERATMDEKDAFPDAADAGRFVVTVPGAGRHDLRLKFAVPAVRRGGDREVRFGVPDVPATAVSLLAGPAGRQPDVLTRRGGQKVQPTGNGPRVEADHGGGATVAVRWRDGGRDDGAKATVAVREFSVWDVGETEATLTAAFAYRIADGPVGRLTIEVPDGVEPLRVLVRAGDAVTPAPRLRGWSVGPPANGWRPLTVRLQEPTDGRLLAVVVGHPRRPLTGRPVLRFPRAVADDADRDSYHAVRLTGVRADGVGVTGAVDFPSDPLQKEFDLPEFNWDAGPAARTVRRARNAAAEFRPNLQPAAAFTAGASEVVATVGRRVTYEGLMRASDPDAVAVEFATPGGVRPTDARGTALAGWAMTGGRLQAWFRQPVPNAAVRWSATAAAEVVPPAGLPAEGVAVDVAWPRWPSAAGAEPIRATVRAAPGFELTPVAVAGLTPVPGAAAGELTYAIEAGNHPPGRFLLKPAPPKPPAVPKAKTADPPPPKADPPAVPPALANEPPSDPGRPWPHGILAWCGGYVAVLALARLGRRFRPESAAGVGVLAALAVGWSSAFGAALFAVAGVGVLVRAARVTRWIWARAT